MEVPHKIDLKARREAAEILSNYIVSSSVTVVRIDPPMAAEMLSLAGSNRNLSAVVVQRYAADMGRGQWLMNGETIKFNDEGELLDGQHRLMAVIEANVSIDSLVVFGIAKDAMPTIDVGLKRTLAHAISISINIGYSSPTHLAAAANLLYRYQLGNIGVGKKITPMSHSEGLELIAAHPGLQQSCVVAARPSFKSFVTPSVGAFCHYILTRVDPKKAEDFFRGLGTGAGLEQSSPVLHLRNFLLGQKAARARASVDVHIAYIFKAWLAFKDGRSIKQLSVKENEKFPIVE